MHEDLLARKPKQVNFRRAVLTAYYAIFHYLVEESCCLAVGRQHGQAVYRHTLGRAFVHTVMKQACVTFAGGTLKAAIIKDLPRDVAGRYPVHISIRKLAEAFGDLQEKRNLADYDRNERFKRSEVLFLIDQAKDATAEFTALPDSDDKRFFLACLWAWKELTNR